MGAFVASQVVKLMIKNDIKVKGAKILNLGITFKENCPDIRNSKAIDVITNLQEYGAEVVTYDPWANAEEVKNEYGIICHFNKEDISQKFDTVILTVAHEEFLELDIKQLLKENGIIYDVKGIFAKRNVSKRL